MKHAMVDLETWGKTAGMALRSIGARQFDPYSDKIGEKFYANISKESCLEVGLKIDPSTEAWWTLPKNAGAAKTLEKDQRHVAEVMRDYCNWFRENRLLFTWSQGANFDQPLLDAACEVVGIGENDRPWKFWDSRCTRTAYGMAAFNTRTVRRVGTHHNALDDADHQIICVQRSHKKLGLHEELV